MKKMMIVLIILFSTKLFAKETVIVYSYNKVSPIIINKLDRLSIDYNFILKVIPKNRLDYILRPWKENNCEDFVRRCYPNWIVLNSKPFAFNELDKTNFLYKQLAFENKKYIMTNKNNKKIIQLLDNLDIKE